MSSRDMPETNQEGQPGAPQSQPDLSTSQPGTPASQPGNVSHPDLGNTLSEINSNMSSMATLLKTDCGAQERLGKSQCFSLVTKKNQKNMQTTITGYLSGDGSASTAEPAAASASEAEMKSQHTSFNIDTVVEVYHFGHTKCHYNNY